MSSKETIRIGDFNIFLTKSARTKHIFLKQNTKGEIVLTYPRLCPKMLAISFAKKQLPWIQAHVLNAPKEIVFTPGDHICVLGQNYLLVHGSRTLLLDKTLIISGDIGFFHRRVCSYVQKMLLPYLQQQVKKQTEHLSVQAKRITLRNTSSRWGSCSSNKNLSFCWKIAFAPQYVVDYLIAHEVAHLVHMNHAAQFWQLVDTLTPHRKQAEKWLKTNGQSLQRIR